MDVLYGALLRWLAPMLPRGAIMHSSVRVSQPPYIASINNIHLGIRR
jgi:hypothetical protein